MRIRKLDGRLQQLTLSIFILNANGDLSNEDMDTYKEILKVVVSVLDYGYDETRVRELFEGLMS